jgi:hypothetical protein
MNSKWIVNTKGAAQQKSWEISVVREDNTHGIKSYGWFDENKQLVSSSGGPSHTPISPVMWDMLVEVAEKYAQTLNMTDSFFNSIKGEE